MVSTAGRACDTLAAAACSLPRFGSSFAAQAAGGHALQARHALAQRIEACELAAQRVLRLERNALDHQAELLAGRRPPAPPERPSSVSSSGGRDAPARSPR